MVVCDNSWCSWEYVRVPRAAPAGHLTRWRLSALGCTILELAENHVEYSVYVTLEIQRSAYPRVCKSIATGAFTKCSSNGEEAPCTRQRWMTDGTRSNKFQLSCFSHDCGSNQCHLKVNRAGCHRRAPRTLDACLRCHCLGGQSKGEDGCNKWFGFAAGAWLQEQGRRSTVEASDVGKFRNPN